MLSAASFSKLQHWGWNQRVLTACDFYDFCEAEDIWLYERLLPVDGIYFEWLEQGIILLNRQLTGWEKAFTAWHEIGHALMHKPGFCGLDSMLWRKFENQSNVVACISLIPKKLLRLPSADLVREYGYSSDLITLRRQVWLTKNL